MHLCIIFQGDFAINTDGGLLDMGLFFGEEFPDLGDLSPPHCESSSSDSYMTPSPNTVDDELLEILSSTSTSPGLPQNSEDVAIDLGKWSSKKKKSVCTEWIFFLTHSLPSSNSHHHLPYNSYDIIFKEFDI